MCWNGATWTTTASAGTATNIHNHFVNKKYFPRNIATSSSADNLAESIPLGLLHSSENLVVTLCLSVCLSFSVARHVAVKGPVSTGLSHIAAHVAAPPSQTRVTAQNLLINILENLSPRRRLLSRLRVVAV